jgi:hypothetical protein
LAYVLTLSTAERRPSPGLSLNLSSNNPFRHRATSPGFPSPANQSDRSSSASRPMSRNPFLSTFEAEFNKEARRTDLIDIDMSASMKASPKKDTFSNGSAAEELFVRHLLFVIAAGEGEAVTRDETLHTAGLLLGAAMLCTATANTRHGAISAFCEHFC